HVRSYEEFQKLLQRYNQRRQVDQLLSVDACRLTATFDPQSPGLSGRGVIESSSTKQGRLILSPWNLPLVSMPADGASDAVWGINETGDLCVASAPDGGFAFQWTLAPTS